jgi:hypothetical protein
MICISFDSKGQYMMARFPPDDIGHQDYLIPSSALLRPTLHRKYLPLFQEATCQDDQQDDQIWSFPFH